MSWQVMLVNLAEPPVEHLMELAEEGMEFPAFGTLNEVTAKINEVLPSTKWLESTSGLLELPDAIIEFDLSVDDKVTEIILNARGSNDLQYIQQLCQANKWSAYDCGTGTVVDAIGPDSGHSAWQDYRDFIV